MTANDHRTRVAAERRERMRLRLLTSALSVIAEKGQAATSIDDVIKAADVSRGTFYKYFRSPEVLVQELALEIANELIRMAEAVVLGHLDPAERVACGIRLITRLALHHPVVAGFVVQLGWPELRAPSLLVGFVRRDLCDGIEQGRFRSMPIALALNIVVGAVLGASRCMLETDCEPDFAEQTAAAALRALGIDAPEADQLASRPLHAVAPVPNGLLAQTLAPRQAA